MGQRHQQRLPARVEQRRNFHQITLDQGGKTGFNLDLHLAAFNPRRMLQPLVATAEHADQQALQSAGVVVHKSQRDGYHFAIGIAALNHFQRPPRRRRVMRRGILTDAGLGTEATEIGHLSGQAGAQRIQRRDA